MYITLDRIKRHLNIDEYYRDEDMYLISLYEVAEKVVEKHCDVLLDEIADRNGGELPQPLRQAILFLIGDYYRTRESISFTSANAIPFTYDYLLSLYKNYGENDNVRI